MKTVMIYGEEYVKKADTRCPMNESGLEYVVVRSRDSGCWAGYLEDREGSEATLVDARRLWFWSGAATLSQLAMEGVKKPDQCKFPMTVAKVTVIGICEIIETTEAARKSLEEVPVWKA